MRKLQYGFRPARSTSQPILILRRLIEIYERGGEPLHLVFLDWKKAFDSVKHSSIYAALYRFSVPEPLIIAIMSLYSESTFIVRDKFSTSFTHVQSIGVRQGCPMSPYLFCMVLSCLMKDVDDQLLRSRHTLPSTFSSKCPFWDLEHADDTVVISNTSRLLMISFKY